ncbi:hypothetical protein KAI46_15820 [bacterium]|nr:hypothetical protein [bacterium]
METKWKTPTTAPKDTVILGWFKNYPFAVACGWDEHDANWAYANLQIVPSEYMDSGKANTYFENDYQEAHELLGWLPLPDIGIESIKPKVRNHRNQG